MKFLIVVFVVLALSFVDAQPETIPASQCEDARKYYEDSCNKSFVALVCDLLSNYENVYNLSRAFFPPVEYSTAVWVTVHYQFADNSTQIWFWSKKTVFFSVPVRVFEYTSLFLGYPEYLTTEISLTLSNCSDPRADYMQLLTQRLKAYAKFQSIVPTISDEYEARAANIDTIAKLYSEGYDYKIAMIYPTVQSLLPVCLWVLTTVHVLCFVINKDKSNERKFKKHNENATFISSSVLSALLVVFVLALDIVAVRTGFYKKPGKVALPPPIYDFYQSKGNFRTVLDHVHIIFAFDIFAALIMLGLIISSCCYRLGCCTPALPSRCYRPGCCTPALPSYCYRPGCCTPAQTTGSADPHKQNSDDSSCSSDEKKELVQRNNDTIEVKDNGKAKQFCFCPIGYNCYIDSPYLPLLAPVFCIETHSLHMLIAFTNDPYHASSIIIYYLVSISVFFFTLKQICSSFFVLEKPENKKCRYIMLFIALVGMLVILLGIQTMTSVYFVLLPIQRAIEEAPQSIMSTNQLFVFFIGALVTYRLLIYPQNDKQKTSELLAPVLEQLAQLQTTVQSQSKSGTTYGAIKQSTAGASTGTPKRGKQGN